MSTQTVQIVGGLALFAVVYAILYRPVMRMFERRLPDGERLARISWYRDRLLWVAVPSVILLDQITKLVVRSNMRLGQSWPEEGFFRFTYGTNTGTAFGLFTNQSFFLIIASLLAIGFIFYFYRAHAMPSRLLRVAIGFLLGGAMGNLLDRLRAGSVVDFIDVGPWPIFNLADSAIVIGIVLLVAVTVLSTDGEARRETHGGADDSAA